MEHPRFQAKPTPGQATVIVQCSRCAQGVAGLFFLGQTPKGPAFQTGGFVLPITANPEIRGKFLPGEIVLCQRCLEGKTDEPEPEPEPLPQLIVPESY